MKTRQTLRLFLKICLGLVTIALLTFYFCTRGSRRDEAALNLMLSTQAIERIELISMDRTNAVAASGLKAFANSLTQSNRIQEYGFTKDQVAISFRIRSQSNEVFWITQFDSGILKFGAYYFSLKAQPNYVETE